MIKTIKSFLLIFVFLFVVECDSPSASTIKKQNLVTIKVFSSLTCPHCASFHDKIFYKLKEEYVVSGKVKFEHHSFPLDLAALNAEIILRCNNSSIIDLDFLSLIYKKQNQWAVGSDINKINNYLKDIGKEFGLQETQMDLCLKNEDTQEKILNSRIAAQKEYNISSTPTIFINNKKYEGVHDYKKFKKELDKLF